MSATFSHRRTNEGELAKQVKSDKEEKVRAMLPKENGQDSRAHQHQTLANRGVSRGPTRNEGRATASPVST